MRRLTATCSIVVVGLALLPLNNCSRLYRPSDEAATADSLERDRRFDPLDLQQDLEIVPEEYPRVGNIYGRETVRESEPFPHAATGDAVVAPPEEIDTFNRQAYRVQLFTSKQYGEARRALRVAQEIFDRRVSLDYEVPYYKVRVGSFADREAADDYQQRAKAAGYREAWVVVTTVGVEEPAPLYPEGTQPARGDDIEHKDGLEPDD